MASSGKTWPTARKVLIISHPNFEDERLKIAKGLKTEFKYDLYEHYPTWWRFCGGATDALQLVLVNTKELELVEAQEDALTIRIIYEGDYLTQNEPKYTTTIIHNGIDDDLYNSIKKAIEKGGFEIKPYETDPKWIKVVNDLRMADYKK
jgi:hypothetical protein